MGWIADWTAEREAKRSAELGMTISQYRAWSDIQSHYHRETCECEVEGGYGDDGSGTRRGISPNYRCEMHRVDDWCDRHDVLGRVAWKATRRPAPVYLTELVI